MNKLEMPKVIQENQVLSFEICLNRDPHSFLPRLNSFFPDSGVTEGNRELPSVCNTSTLLLLPLHTSFLFQCEWTP